MNYEIYMLCIKYTPKIRDEYNDKDLVRGRVTSAFNRTKIKSQFQYKYFIYSMIHQQTSDPIVVDLL